MPTPAQAVLDGLVDDPEYVWFAHLVNAGFYADPANGGNDDGASWRMLGWSPAPAGGWPAEDVWVPDRGAGHPSRPGGRALRRRGGGFGCRRRGGGLGAGAVRPVGPAGGAGRLPGHGLPGSRSPAQRPHRQWTGPSDAALVGGESAHPAVGHDADPVVVPAWDPRYGSNADTFGGGTRVYGAQAWRFMPEDFAMASTYGVPEGSALADWPIGYDEMEPFYTQAEYEIGVCGSDEPHAGSTRRSRPYPMAPMALTAPARRLLAGARVIGLTTVPVPLAINSTPYDGRAACARCRQCVGFTCPVEAKNSSDNTVLARAAATGNLSVLLATRAERIVSDTAGRVTGVGLVGDHRRLSLATHGGRGGRGRRGRVRSSRPGSCWPAEMNGNRTAWATTTTRSAATCRGTSTAGRSGSSTTRSTIWWDRVRRSPRTTSGTATTVWSAAA